MSPGGVRIGAPALTTRGMKEPEFRQIAQFMSRAAELAIKIQAASGKMLKDFTIAIEVGWGWGCFDRNAVRPSLEGVLSVLALPLATNKAHVEEKPVFKSL